MADEEISQLNMFSYLAQVQVDEVFLRGPLYLLAFKE